jgi:hypothetical protein
MCAVFLALVAYAGPNDRHWDQQRPDDPFWTNVAVPVARFSTRLQGRIIGTLIRDGMTRQQTDWILGDRRMGNSAAILLAAGVVEHRFLYRLGITITYFDDRVDGVRFSRFFD